MQALKKTFYSCLILFLFPLLVVAQHGSVDNSLTIDSEILDRQMSYSVYLPESYHSSTRDYPVLYLMHGMTGDHSDWIVKGEVQRIAGKAITEGAAPEMIIVMPDGLYDSFYINNYDGSVKWEDFFHEEFIPGVEEAFRIIPDRSTRAIAGLSMGGYGAMYHAIKYKENFSAVYAMSAAFLEVESIEEGEERSEWNQEFNLKTWGPDNEDRYPENYKKHSIQEMFLAMDPIQEDERPWSSDGEQEVSLPAIFIDCGDDDFLLNENMNLVKIMNEKNVDFEFRVHDGGHTWEYWRTALAKTMKFVGNSFRN